MAKRRTNLPINPALTDYVKESPDEFKEWLLDAVEAPWRFAYALDIAAANIKDDFVVRLLCESVDSKYNVVRHSAVKNLLILKTIFPVSQVLLIILLSTDGLAHEMIMPNYLDLVSIMMSENESLN